MRILVTGAGGFVGRALLPRLAANGWTPVGRDLDLDVTDAQAIEASVGEIAPDGLVHLAAQSSVAQSLHDAEQTFRVNFVGARNVLGAVARRAPRCRVLLVGSGDVYGSAGGESAPVSERAPLRPGSPYARTKACADLLGALYAQRGLDVIRVRPFNHAGPGQRDSFVVASFARQIAEIELGRQPDRIRVGNLESVRDFLDVEDVVDAYALLFERHAPAGVYNVASGRGVSVGALLDGLLAHSTLRPRIEPDPARHRPTDHLIGDASRLQAATGWSPRTPLSRTLARALDDWRLRVCAA